MKIITKLNVISILLLCLAYNTNAQNYINGTTFTVNLGCNNLDYGGVEFINDKPYPLVLNWVKLLEDTVPESSFDMCANAECYVGVPDTGSNWTFPVPQNNIGFFKMHYWTGDSTGTSTLKIYVFEPSFPNNGDTLTYILNISCGGVGIKENNNVPPFKIFPLPADDYITLEFNNPFVSDLYVVNIMDALGRKVLSEKIRTINSNRLTTSTIPNGVYWLQIIGKDKKAIYTEKIVIHHN